MRIPQKILHMTVSEYVAEQKPAPLAEIRTKNVCLSLPESWVVGLQRIATKMGQKRGLKMTVQDLLRFVIVHRFLLRKGEFLPSFKTLKPKRIAGHEGD